MDITIRMEKHKLLQAIRKQRQEHELAYRKALASWRGRMSEMGCKLAEVAEKL